MSTHDRRKEVVTEYSRSEGKTRRYKGIALILGLTLSNNIITLNVKILEYLYVSKYKYVIISCFNNIFNSFTSVVSYF